MTTYCSNRRLYAGGRPLAALLALTLMVAAWVSQARAAAYIPRSSDEVVARLPGSADPELARLRQRLALAPKDVDAALALADSYLDQAKASGDARYLGMAQAALAPWWWRTQLPWEVRLRRADIRQHQHRFQGALTDLDTLIRARPWDARPRAMRASVLQVTGEYALAAEDCKAMVRGAGLPLAAACQARVQGLAGAAESAYTNLHAFLPHASNSQERLELRVTLADLAVWSGQVAAADEHFRAAVTLAPGHGYALERYSDFLLQSGRYDEVLMLLPEQTVRTDWLVNRARACQALDCPEFARLRADLAARFEAALRRDDWQPGRAYAAYLLDLLEQPAAAFTAAMENWRLQREPADSGLVLRAAETAGVPEAAQAVREWLTARGAFKTVRLSRESGDTL